jgi:HSP20 family protein
MASFLEKLKLIKEEKEEKPITKEEKLEPNVLQLGVDIYQSPSEIIILSQIPGSEVKDLDIFLGEDNDVVTIEGKIELPQDLKIEDPEIKLICQECKWGKFYRQIILPDEVDPEKIEAKLKNGILILRLPFLKTRLIKKRKVQIKTE